LKYEKKLGKYLRKDRMASLIQRVWLGAKGRKAARLIRHTNAAKRI